MAALAWALPVALLVLTAWYIGVIVRRGRAWDAIPEDTFADFSRDENLPVRPAQVPSPKWGEVAEGRRGTAPDAVLVGGSGAWLPPLAAADAAPTPIREEECVRFSVIIAARNEAANLPALLMDLATQDYAAGRFEIIVADDHSTDDTAAVVKAFAAGAPVSVRLLRLAELPTAGQGKKAALAAALRAARHPWIACTDADCRVGPRWLAALAAQIQHQPDLDFVSGPVALWPDGSALARLQVVEFAGLVGVGAASLALGAPNMCNGANLAYRRAAWEAVNGQLLGQHVASGDDEFLLHTLWARRPGSAAFVKSRDAIVRTAAAPGLRAFLRQRVRWASKWPHYRRADVQRLAAGVFGVNLLLLVGVFWALRWPITGPAVGAAWLGKLAADAWFLRKILRFQGEGRHFLPAVLGWQLLYVPYVLFTALLSARGQYQWKDRTVR